MTLKNMISRRTFSGLLSAIVVASVIPGIVQARDMTVANNVVLVHGLYADGSSWVDEIPYLQRAGLQVSAVQNPLTSLADDVAATRRVLELQDGPTCGPVPFAVAPRNPCAFSLEREPPDRRPPRHTAGGEAGPSVRPGNA
jgi:hypothetical protein